MLEYLDLGIFRPWRENGGLETLHSYLDGTRKKLRDLDLPSTHIDFVRATKIYYETDNFFFVHGGLKSAFSIEENLRRFDEEAFLWERSHLEAPTLVWEKTVICGHTPLQHPIARDRLIAIDTGCVYHRHPHLGRLTAVRLPGRQFVSVPYAG